MLHPVVDDFEVKYNGEEHVQHLINIVQITTTSKLTGRGKDISDYPSIGDWDYNKREVHIFMPEYVADACKRFKHPHPNKPQRSRPTNSFPLHTG